MCKSLTHSHRSIGYISLLRALDLQRIKTILLRRELKEYSVLTILHDHIVGHAWTDQPCWREVELLCSFKCCRSLSWLLLFRGETFLCFFYEICCFVFHKLSMWQTVGPTRIFYGITKTVITTMIKTISLDYSFIRKWLC